MLKGMDPLFESELLCAFLTMSHGAEIGIVGRDYRARAHQQRRVHRCAAAMLAAALTSAEKSSQKRAVGKVVL